MNEFKFGNIEEDCFKVMKFFQDYRQDHREKID